jgi:hypothetical protein
MPPVKRGFFAYELSRTFGARRPPKSQSRVNCYVSLARARADPYPRLHVFLDSGHTKDARADHSKRCPEFALQIKRQTKNAETYSINAYQSVANVLNDQEILKRTVWPEQSAAPRRVDFHLWNSLGAEQVIVRQFADIGGPFARQLKWVMGRGHHSQASDDAQLRVKLPKFVTRLTGLTMEVSQGNAGEFGLTVRATEKGWEEGVGGGERERVEDDEEDVKN